MEIEDQLQGSFWVIRLNGRLDGAHAPKLQTFIDSKLVSPEIKQVALDMQHVQYLSSAGIRVLVSTVKQLRARGGDLIVTGLHGYCAEVLKVAGFDKLLTCFGSVEEAERNLRTPHHSLPWSSAQRWNTDHGTYRSLKHAKTPSRALILGHIEDVLYSRVTEEMIHSKPFSSIEYSIGCGGLGSRVEDYLPIMGEMITIGGTMVWLPTDGKDTPDFLIPHQSSDSVTVRTNFNVAMEGDWQEYLLFESNQAEGITISQLYRDLFEYVKTQYPDFRGGLGLALRAEMPATYGSGITRSPILENQPANKQMVTHPDNVKEWFELDQEPRQRNVTGVIAGIGIDLTADYSQYDSQKFGAAFYVNPGNKGATNQILHNHAVFFNPLPFPEDPGSIDEEIRNVVQQGTFVDMRHLLDSSTVRQAIIGLSCIHEFARDTSGIAGHR
jgi:anti-anti-sigma factor